MVTRRDVVKSGLTAAGLGAAANTFGWVLPALAQGESVVPFTDWPANYNPNPAVDRRTFDTRTVSGPFTPKDQFFTTQHYGHPEVDSATYRLKVGGLVKSPLTLTIDGRVFRSSVCSRRPGFRCARHQDWRPRQSTAGSCIHSPGRVRPPANTRLSHV